MTDPSSRRPGVLGIVAAFVLLALAVVGASIGAGGFLAARPAQPTAAPIDRPGDRIRWSTGIVQLAATDLQIRANGLTFVAPQVMDVRGDPGNLTSWTLEAAWKENGREQRLNLYFEADQRSWWIDEVRAYDGAAAGTAEWVRFPRGPFAKTPLGVPFDGDLVLDGTSATGPVHLALDGLRIAVRPQDPVNHPIGGGIVLRENADPFDPGGPLHCSGILQQEPRVVEAKLLALGYQLSWRWEYSTGGNTGYAEVRTAAPETGWITGTAVGTSGELIVFVADPARPFGGPARPLPPDCPSASG